MTLKQIAIFILALMTLNLMGCATAVTSYTVTTGNHNECQFKIMADTASGVSVLINDSSPCEPKKRNGDN